MKRPGANASIASLGLGLALTLPLCPETAWAGNGFGREPRAVTWPLCADVLRIVDRSLSPRVRLHYGFYGEDDLRPLDAKDEVHDSRRHQLFASCREREVGEALPTWLSRADVAAAAELGLVDSPIAGKEVLDENPDWEQCLRRIVPDHERRPITRPSAAAGVVWDTQGLPEGSYIIEGYTHEPPMNRWSATSMPGTYLVVDQWDPTNHPPSAAFTTGRIEIYRNETAQLFVCATAMPGSSYEVHWRPTMPAVDEGHSPRWQVLTTRKPMPSDQGFSVSFTPPADLVQSTVTEFHLRLQIVDPLGRAHLAHARHPVSVAPFDIVHAGATEGGAVMDRGNDTTSVLDSSADEGCHNLDKPAPLTRRILRALLAVSE